MADAPEIEGGGVAHERICWQCGETYTEDLEFCPDDGSQLVEIDPTETKDMLIGRVFDYRFRIVGKLGEGGMSRVYSARRLDGEGEVALKVLKADFLRDPEVRKRFMYEARVISNLEHPNAVDLFDFGQAPDGSFYMVMELLKGESLADRLDGGALTYREIFAIVPPICGVLDEAHQQDVIHRDLKPENIYLAEMGDGLPVPKLLDFGIAKHLRSRTMTKNDQLWGTPAYMSPEQAAGEPVAGTADIYAMGVMLYELIGGVLPFRASTAMGFAVKHMHREANTISSLPGIRDIPPRLDHFVSEMLSKDPADRPATMEMVADELRAIQKAVFDDRLLGTIPSSQVQYDQLEEPIEEEVFTPGENAGGIEIDEALRGTDTELLDADKLENSRSSEGGVQKRRRRRTGSDFETQPNSFDWLGDDMTPWFRQPLPLAGAAAGVAAAVVVGYFLLSSGGPGGGETSNEGAASQEQAMAAEPGGDQTGEESEGAKATYVSKAAGYAASVRVQARGVAESVASASEDAETDDDGTPDTPEWMADRGDEPEPENSEESNETFYLETPESEEPERNEDDRAGGQPAARTGGSKGSSGGREKEKISEDNVNEALESTF